MTGTIGTKEGILGHLKMKAYANLIDMKKMDETGSNIDCLTVGIALGLETLQIFGQIERIENQPAPSVKCGTQECWGKGKHTYVTDEIYDIKYKVSNANNN